MSALFVQSLLDGTVIDVQGAKAVAGTGLDAYPIKLNVSSPTAPTPAQLASATNQLWTFVAGPTAGTFFIESQLGNDLVIDVTGGKAVSGTLIEVNKKTGAKSQLWYWVPVEEPHASGQLYMTYYQLASALDTGLVVDIKGASTSPGARLQIYTKKPTATMIEFDVAKNQLWSQTPTWYGPPPQ